MSSLADALSATLRRRAGADALHFDAKWSTFADLDRLARGCAQALADAGLVPGDHVAVGLPSSVELVGWTLGTLYAGGVLVPLNPAYTADELTYVVSDVQARFAIVAEPCSTLLAAARLPGLRLLPVAAAPAETAAIADRRPEDPALIIYTSGTTGRPKGAVLPHRALLANLTAVVRAWRWTEDDRVLLVLPCFHLHGLGIGLLASFLTGSSVVLRPRFQLDDLLPDIERHQVTIFLGVPTIYNRLVSLPESVVAGADLTRVRLWISGSAPLNPVTYERFRARFGYSLMDRYGMTECCFVLSTDCAGRRRPGVVGRPLPGVDVRLVDHERADGGEIVDVPDGMEGEILVRGPNLFLGYWNRPEATAAALLAEGSAAFQSGEAYLRTGDIAVRESDGQFRIIGRSSVDIIKTRGFKVGAGEIEEVLQRYPDVQEVAVVGIADPDQGERIVAVVSPLGGARPSTEGILDFARQHLAPHKVPSRIELMDEIPRTGPGKFKKKELIARLCQES